MVMQRFYATRYKKVHHMHDSEVPAHITRLNWLVSFCKYYYMYERVPQCDLTAMLGRHIILQNQYP